MALRLACREGQCACCIFMRRLCLCLTLGMCLLLLQTQELADSQFDQMEIGGIPGMGRGKGMQASKGQAQKGRR